jgi:hypothetical protein
MIDDLLRHVHQHSDLYERLLIPGEQLRRANKVRISSEFDGYTAFLTSKVPTTITTNPAPNAWTKRREPTTMDYTNAQFPSLPHKKARVDDTDSNTSGTSASSNTSDTIIVDLEAELTKERNITDGRLNEIQQSLSAEIEKMKVAFNEQIKKSIVESEQRMTAVIQQHIGEILRTSESAIARIENKANEVSDSLLQIMQTKTTPKRTRSPARKQQRLPSDDIDMTDDENLIIAPVTPASHLSPSYGGRNEMAGERK